MQPAIQLDRQVRGKHQANGVVTDDMVEGANPQDIADLDLERLREPTVLRGTHYYVIEIGSRDPSDHRNGR